MTEEKKDMYVLVTKAMGSALALKEASDKISRDFKGLDFKYGIRYVRIARVALDELEAVLAEMDRKEEARASPTGEAEGSPTEGGGAE